MRLFKNLLPIETQDEFVDICLSPECYWQHQSGLANDIFYHTIFDDNGMQSKLMDKMPPIFMGLGIGFSKIVSIKIIKIAKHLTEPFNLGVDLEKPYHNILYNIMDNDIIFDGETLLKGDTIIDDKKITLENKKGNGSNFIWVVLEK